MKRYSATKTIPPFGRAGEPSRTSSWRFQATQKTQVYDAIVAAGPDGLTRPEVAAKVGLQPDRISFYLSDLRRAGFIEVKGDPSVVNANMTADEAAFAAMLGLENALVARARESGATDEMNRGFVKYQKIKELSLRPGTTGEGKVALRMAILELVKLVF